MRLKEDFSLHLFNLRGTKNRQQDFKPQFSNKMENYLRNTSRVGGFLSFFAAMKAAVCLFLDPKEFYYASITNYKADKTRINIAKLTFCFCHRSPRKQKL